MEGAIRTWTYPYEHNLSDHKAIGIEIKIEGVDKDNLDQGIYIVDK